MPLVMGPPREEGLPDLAKFLGRFHPVVLHLPIGVLVWVLVQEALGLRSKGRSGPSSRTAAGFAAISAVAACTLGFLLYYSMPDYDRELAERHLWGGTLFACLMVTAYVVKVWVDAAGLWSAVYRVVLLAGTGVMFAASHDGASLTHGKGYLTEYAPAPVRSALGLPAKEVKERKDDSEDPAAEKAPEDPVVYASLIAPVLEKKCYQCHNADKQKGKYRMDEYPLLLKGGVEGEAIVPGDPGSSLVLTRIRLPEDDEEHMPPEGKKDIEEHELVLLDWWVAEGAPEKARLSEMKATDAVRAALAKLGAAAVKQEAPQARAAGPDPQLDARVAALRKEFPATLDYEYRGSGQLVFTAAGMRAKFGDEQLAKLVPVMPAMVSMDLSGTVVTAKGLRALSGASSLRMLRLAETGVGDEVMDTLAGLQSLESLNLFGTKVSGAGVSRLATLGKLRKLYLWQTEVDAKALEELRKALPECGIVTGI